MKTPYGGKTASAACAGRFRNRSLPYRAAYASAMDKNVLPLADQDCCDVGV